MKTISSFLLMAWLCLSLICHAQPENKLTKDVVMPTPKAAAFGKYGDIPVSFATGVPNISLPLLTMTEGPLSLPISLSYHSGGIRVGEMASWVGLGWTLNGGGMISRTVLGIPDETAQGFWYTGDSWGLVDLVDDRDIVCAIGNGTLDGEADLYSFSFPGYSGKFFFDREKRAHIIPQGLDIKVEYQFNEPENRFDYFTLITPDGTRYIFGKDGDQDAIERLQTGTNSSAFSPWVNSWMLVRVSTPDDKFSISYSYLQEPYNYKSLASCSYRNFQDFNGASSGVSCPGNNGEEIANHPYVQQYVTNGKRLHQITTSNATLTFSAETGREDLELNPNRLDRIVYTTNQTNGSCTEFQFDYDYFEDPDYPQFEFAKRLKLNSVQELSCDNTVQKAPYNFEYYGDPQRIDFLPHRLSKAQDHWGYYNGKHNPNDNISNNRNDVNIPPTALTHPLSGIPLPTYGNSNRETDETYLLYGTLKTITYPTGGTSEFTFEANRIPSFETANREDHVINLSSCGTLGPNCCGELSKTANDPVTFETIEILNSAFFDLELNRIEGESECTTELVSGSVVIYQGGNEIGSWGFNLEDDESTRRETRTSLSDITPLTLDVPYTFVVKSTNGRAVFNLYSEYGQAYKDYLVGGLRVKEIKHSDGLSSANDIVKSYTYTKEEEGFTVSSGILNEMPRYGRAVIFPGIRVQNVVIGDIISEERFFMEEYSADSYVPLGDFDGRHIIYSHVQEFIEGNGTTTYEIFSDDFEEKYTPPPFELLGPGAGFNLGVYGDVYGPKAPQLFKRNQGLVKKSKTFKENGQLVASTDNIPYYLSSYTEAGYFAKIQSLICDPGALAGTYFYGIVIYKPRTDANLFSSTTTTLDGVSTTTTYDYAAHDLHHNPIKIQVENSNGRISEQRFKYPQDYQDFLEFGNGSNASISDLVNQHMIGAPIETQTWEGPEVNNLKMMGGQVTSFKDFRSEIDIQQNRGAKILKPFQIYLLETDSGLEEGSGLNNSKDGNGLYQLLQPQQVSSSYTLRADFFYEDTYGNLTEQTLTNGPPVSYLWGRGGNRPLAKVVGKTYEEISSFDPEQLRLQFDQALVTTYEYNDRLQLKSVTGPDGITTHYEYDALGRLINTSDDDEKLLQQVFYNYGNQ